MYVCVRARILVYRSNINSNDVPPGALVSFVQKGLQYLELEANLTRVSTEQPTTENAATAGGGAAAQGGNENTNNATNNKTEGNGGGADYVMEGSFGALTPAEMMMKDITQLRAVVNERRENNTTTNAANTTTTTTSKGGKAGGGPKKGSNQYTVRRDREKEAANADRQGQTGSGRGDAAANNTTSGGGSKRAKGDAGADAKARTKDKDGTGKGKDDAAPKSKAANAREEKGTVATNGDAPVRITGGGGGGGEKGSGGVTADAKKDGNTDAMLVEENATTTTTKKIAAVKSDKPEVDVQPRSATNTNTNTATNGGGEEDAEMADAEEEAKKAGPEAARRNEMIAAAQRIPESDVMVLSGHTHEVFFCSWNPKVSLLASGSGDETARIWTIPEGPVASSSFPSDVASSRSAAGVAVPSEERPDAASSGPGGSTSMQKHGNLSPKVAILTHTNTENYKNEVTTLDWNSSGTLLATGSYDGKASIWNREGKIQYTLDAHQGPIFSMKWNFSSNLILSGSLDKTAIVWNAETGEAMKQFSFHDAPMLDVDWRNDHQFATCSTDRIICVCQVDSDVPLSRFSGHENEVNAIEWDPQGRVLASCSDDNTAKIWRVEPDDNGGQSVTTLVHDKEVYTLKWRRTEHGQPSNSGLLATASFDTTVKLWDVERSVAVHTLGAHSMPVYTIAFHPDGQFLLSGSFDKYLHVWSVRDGSLVRTYESSGGIFEACWNNDGTKMAACHADNTVSVIDFRK